jgi:phage repressor protein C with HTH and peptisase S24 domain/DNA-binding XRE family transcriptional regulator
LEISDKLLKLRISSGKSQAEFAKLADVSQRTWSSYESGQTTPKMGVLWVLAAKGYPIEGLTTLLADELIKEGKIDKAELQRRQEIARKMAGEASPETPVDEAWGEKVNTEYRRQTYKNALKVYAISELSKDSFVVPLVAQRLSAGSGSYVPDEDEAKALIRVPSYLAQYGENIAALTVDGDSMEPTLHRGDMVVCDSLGWSGEGIYALLISGDGFVKRITKAPGKVVIISDNQKYPVREEPEESQDLHIIGRVHCAITKVE